MLELLAEKSDFEEIPEILVNDEVEKMFHELEHSIEKQGGTFADYLSTIDKTPTQVKEDMRPQGLIRVKVAILLEEIAKKEGVEISQEDVDAEIQKQLEWYKDNEKAQERIQNEAYKRYMEFRLRNQRTIDLLKKQMVK